MLLSRRAGPWILNVLHMALYEGAGQWDWRFLLCFL